MPQPNVPTRAGALAAKRLLASRGARAGTVHVAATRKGLHLRIWLVDGDGRPTSVDAITALAVQTLLGDDPGRQEFNRTRVLRGERGWNVLWNAKFRNGKQTSWEKDDRVWTERFRRWLGAALFCNAAGVT